VGWSSFRLTKSNGTMHVAMPTMKGAISAMPCSIKQPHKREAGKTIYIHNKVTKSDLKRET